MSYYLIKSELSIVMRENRKTSKWVCRKCDYTLDIKEFEDRYVFWFCDGSNAFLNNQALKRKVLGCTVPHDSVALLDIIAAYRYNERKEGEDYDS